MVSEIKCPVCGGEMRSLGSEAPCWQCRNGACDVYGPIDDKDGSVVSRLVLMPDPAKEHEGLEPWQVVWLSDNHGGEWSICGPGCGWVDASGCRPNGDDLGYSWRPTPPAETRVVGLSLAEVLGAEPDGERCWGEFFLRGTTVNRYALKGGILMVAVNWPHDAWEAAYLYPRMLDDGGWALVTKGGAE